MAPLGAKDTLFSIDIDLLESIILGQEGPQFFPNLDFIIIVENSLKESSFNDSSGTCDINHFQNMAVIIQKEACGAKNCHGKWQT